jgi:hypothetical protein
MPKKKPTLQHVHFGDCKILDAFYTASSGSAYFKVQCEAGEKQLLAAPEYWLSSPQHVSAAFDALSAKTLALEKAKRAAERRKDKKELEIETDESEFAEAAADD